VDLNDNTNIADLIETLSHDFYIEVVVGGKYHYQLNIPQSISAFEQSFPEVQRFKTALQAMSSDKQTKFFLSNFTNIHERISQLNQSGISNCEAHELEHFLLRENQNETLRDIKGRNGDSTPGTFYFCLSFNI
jgi:hypothetical protein